MVSIRGLKAGRERGALASESVSLKSVEPIGDVAGISQAAVDRFNNFQDTLQVVLGGDTLLKCFQISLGNDRSFQVGYASIKAVDPLGEFTGHVGQVGPRGRRIAIGFGRLVVGCHPLIVPHIKWNFQPLIVEFRKPTDRL